MFKKREISLSKEEEREASIWRIKKCGYDSFNMLFKKFGEEMKSNAKSKK